MAVTLAEVLTPLLLVYQDSRSASLAHDDALDRGTINQRRANDRLAIVSANQYVAELDGIADRRAAFKTVAIVVWPDGSEVSVEGVCAGVITTEERGGDGFSYDAVFQPDDADGATFAQMDRAAKNAISHRGRAFNALLEQLAQR